MLAPHAFQIGWGDKTTHTHKGGKFDVHLPLGDVLIKLQITLFDLPEDHPWVTDNGGRMPTRAERLWRWGIALREGPLPAV